MAKTATPCITEICGAPAELDHFLCSACWRRLPFALAQHIARARVAGDVDRLDTLKPAAVAHLRTGAAAYDRISALLGERDPTPST